MDEPKEELILIPPEKLSAEVLEALMEEFILREGTDYGHSEKDLNAKKETLRKQMRGGHIFIAYSTLTEDTSLLTKSQLPKNITRN